MTEAVQNTFQSYHEEIRRRDNVTKTDYNSKYFEPVKDDEEGEDLSFVQEDQRFVLFSLSHEEFAPVSECKNAPALRIYGAFPDIESVREHVKAVRACDSTCSLLVHNTHEWGLGGSCPAHLADDSYVRRKREHLLELYEKRMDKNKRQFDENVTQRQVGNNEKTVERDNRANDVSSKTKVGRKAPMAMVMRDQRVVALSVIQDDSADCEFLFRVYGCFETEKDANRWVRNVGGNHITDHDIDVVSTCEWMYPQSMLSSNARKEVFRSPELDKIMRNYKSKPEEVRKVIEDAATPA